MNKVEGIRELIKDWLGIQSDNRGLRKKFFIFNKYRDIDKLAKAIQSYYLGLLPKKWEHSKDCLYVIEPRYYGNSYKEKHCNCGTVYYNEAISEMLSKIKGDV